MSEIKKEYRSPTIFDTQELTMAIPFVAVLAAIGKAVAVGAAAGVSAVAVSKASASYDIYSSIYNQQLKTNLCT